MLVLEENLLEAAKETEAVEPQSPKHSAKSYNDQSIFIC